MPKRKLPADNLLHKSIGGRRGGIMANTPKHPYSTAARKDKERQPLDKRPNARYLIVTKVITSRKLTERAKEHGRHGKRGVMFQCGPRVSRKEALAWERNYRLKQSDIDHIL